MFFQSERELNKYNSDLAGPFWRIGLLKKKKKKTLKKPARVGTRA
ncbi:unnamed protein product [Chondrus crispus]|uniref:Uncharacterized protein n=1 Tax=Chondrus crispus TaxID=2769 RepID=R7QGQ0_CHOCR|nr:unnamed protein product [Chondrus crispus]CDF37264.1 unnamed protein product [Chondrus crispus]|eukprot:XP_005717083.1 unnamed protein product [Chondrus crispus]